MPMARSVMPSAIKKSGKFTVLSARGISIMKITAATVPSTIKGMRFPNRVSTLSDQAPKSGSKKSARILSIDIMAPVMVSPILNVFFSIRGTMLS